MVTEPWSYWFYWLTLIDNCRTNATVPRDNPSSRKQSHLYNQRPFLLLSGKACSICYHFLQAVKIREVRKLPKVRTWNRGRLRGNRERDRNVGGSPAVHVRIRKDWVGRSSGKTKQGSRSSMEIMVKLLDCSPDPFESFKYFGLSEVSSFIYADKKASWGGFSALSVLQQLFDAAFVAIYTSLRPEGGLWLLEVVAASVELLWVPRTSFVLTRDSKSPLNHVLNIPWIFDHGEEM